MSDDPIYICNDCNRTSNGGRCVCGSDDLIIQSRYDEFYFNDDPVNFALELYERENK